MMSETAGFCARQAMCKLEGRQAMCKVEGGSNAGREIAAG